MMANSQRITSVKCWLLLVLLVLMVACGGGDEGNSTDNASDEEENTPGNEENTAVESNGEGDDETGDNGEMAKSGVAILVIDAFNLPQNSDDTSQGSEGTCTVTPDGQIFRGDGLIFRGDGLGWVKLPDVSHGELVYTQLSELITQDLKASPFVDSTGLDLQSTLSGAEPNGSWDATGLDWMGDIRVWDVNGNPLLLVAIDTSQYDTTALAERLPVAMDALVNSPWQVKKFVLNMSFGYVPCNATITFEEYQELLDGDEELQKLEAAYSLIELGDSLYALTSNPDSGLSTEDVDLYLQGLATLYNAYKFLSVVVESESPVEPIESEGLGEPEWFKNDPTRTLFASFYEPSESSALPQSVEAVILVAASGNSGLPFPFAPAIWDDVISVSTQAADEATGSLVKADYANNGEVMMPFTFSFGGESLLGTSFAAPELSLRIASYLQTGGAISCSGAVAAAAPPFDYATLTGPWSDLALNVARNDYCAIFP